MLERLPRLTLRTELTIFYIITDTALSIFALIGIGLHASEGSSG